MEGDRRQSIQQDRADFNFQRVAERARVIKDGGEPVLVPYGRGKKFIAAIRKKNRFFWRTLRKLQRFTVNLRERDLAALRQTGQVQPLIPGQEGPFILDEGSYHPQLGVMVGGRPAEEYLV